jgi:hypothetical protein
MKLINFLLACGAIAKVTNGFENVKINNLITLDTNIVRSEAKIEAKALQSNPAYYLAVPGATYISFLQVTVNDKDLIVVADDMEK